MAPSLVSASINFFPQGFGKSLVSDSIADGASVALGAERGANDSGDSSEDDMNSQDAEASDREYFEYNIYY